MFEDLRRAIDQQPVVQGFTIIDMLGFPPPLGSILKPMVHQGPRTLSALAADLSLTIAETRLLGEMMVEKGLLTATEHESDREIVYHVRLVGVQKHKSTSGLLGSIEDG